MSSVDTSTSDGLTSLNDVTAMVIPVTSGMSPNELCGESSTASMGLAGPSEMLSGGFTFGSGIGSGLHLASGYSLMVSTLPVLSVLSCASCASCTSSAQPAISLHGSVFAAERLVMVG